MNDRPEKPDKNSRKKSVRKKKKRRPDESSRKERERKERLSGKSRRRPPRSSSRPSGRKKEASDAVSGTSRRSTVRRPRPGGSGRSSRRSSGRESRRESFRNPPSEETGGAVKSIKENLPLIVGGLLLAGFIVLVFVIPAVRLSSALSAVPDLPVDPSATLIENATQPAYKTILSFGSDAASGLEDIVENRGPGTPQAVIVLGVLKDPDAIYALKELAMNADGVDRQFAIQALAQYGKKNLMHLKNLFDATDTPEVRACVLEAVHGIEEDISDYHYLFFNTLENTRDETVLRPAVLAVKERRLTRAIPELITLMEEGPGAIPELCANVLSGLARERENMMTIAGIACGKSEALAKRALSVFENMGPAVAAPYIFKVVHSSENFALRLRALGLLATPEAKVMAENVGNLLQTEKNEKLKIQALETLGKMNVYDSWKVLTRALSDSSTAVRKQAVTALRDFTFDLYAHADELGQLPHGKLIGLLQDESIPVQREAVRTLKSLSGQDFSQWDVEKWKAWWRKQQEKMKLVTEAMALEKKGKQMARERKFGEGKQYLDKAEELYKKVIEEAPGRWKDHFREKLQKVKVLQYQDMKNKAVDIYNDK